LLPEDGDDDFKEWAVMVGVGSRTSVTSLSVVVGLAGGGVAEVMVDMEDMEETSEEGVGVLGAVMMAEGSNDD